MKWGLSENEAAAVKIKQDLVWVEVLGDEPITGHTISADGLLGYFGFEFDSGYANFIEPVCQGGWHHVLHHANET